MGLGLSEKSFVEEFYQFRLEADKLENCPRCSSSNINISLWSKNTDRPTCDVMCIDCVDIETNDIIGISVTIEGVREDVFNDGCKWAIWETRRACNFTGVAAWNAYAKYLKVEPNGINK